MGQKVAWITGASTGIGAETAKILAREGWTVAITARSEDKLKALEQEVDGIKAYSCDVTNEQDMAQLVEKIEAECGPIDMAFMNAGMFNPDTYETYTAENFKNHFEVNVFGAANGIAPVLQNFKQRGRGHFVMTASVAGYQGLPRSMSYGPTKSALINFAESLWLECKEHGIKVQVVCPGFVKTPMTAQNKFPMPMIMELEEAAEKLVKGMKSNQFEINFPWAFAWILKIGAILPRRVKLNLIHFMTQKAMKSAKDKKD